MAGFAAGRAILRSAPLRRVANAVPATASKASARPSLSFLKQRPAAPRILRSPVELSCCVESLLPMHSATASALLTSMLSTSRGCCAWVSEGNDDIR